MRQAYVIINRVEFRIPEQRYEAASAVFAAKLEKSPVYFYEGKERIFTGKYVYPERLKGVF